MSVQAELDCDAVVRGFPGAPTPQILVLSIPKETWLADVPDRRYFVRGVALWWEVKSERDKLTEGQYAFLKREHDHGALVGCGDWTSLRDLLYEHLPSQWAMRGWIKVEHIAKRGFRKAA